MKKTIILYAFFIAMFGISSFAQNAQLDSTKAAITLSKLLSVCKNVAK